MSRLVWLLLLLAGTILLLIADVLGVVRRQTPRPAWQVAALEENGSYEIFLINGDQRKNLTRHPASDSFPLWSPAGLWIVFISDRDGNFEIYRAHPQSWRVQNLSLSPEDDLFPQWSPDGQWIAYETWTGGNREIMRVRPDGSGQQNLSQHPADDWFPRWSSDGQWIIFRSTRSGSETAYQMSVDGTEVYARGAAPVIDLDWRPAYPFFGGAACLIAALSLRLAWVRNSTGIPGSPQKGC